MRRRSSISAYRRSSTCRRRSENMRFDEFGFAVAKRKDQKVNHRCHDYSYPHLSSVRVKELCELLSYWNGASFICKNQIERFIRIGIPPSLRGRVWKCLLSVDSLRETSNFNYQTCLSEVRGPLVDLGVSEYSILSAITTLSDTQNDLGLHQHGGPDCSVPCFSVEDITLFRQIALDLQRSFPTHRSLMGESPEAIEGQAKLFRVLIAYAKYNPQVGYSQGMSYIAAVLLMHLGEEEAFWALTALLDKPTYLAELFDLSLTRAQLQVKVFDQLLKHRKPRLSQHMESVGVSSVFFVMPWFLTLFTSLPCWDTVLAVWDLIFLYGRPAVFRTALTIVELLEPRIMDLHEEGAVLPLLLRVPVDVAQYNVFVSSLWNTEVQDWELKCMNSLVLEEHHHTTKEEEFEKQKATVSSQVTAGKQREKPSTSSEGQKTAEKDSVPGGLSVLTKIMCMAQRYLFKPLGRQHFEEKSSQPQVTPRRQSPGRVFRSQTSASTQSQGRLRRRNQQKVSAHQPVVQGSSAAVSVGLVTADCGKSERCEQTSKGSFAGPGGKVDRCSSKRSIIHHVRSKSVRHIRNGKGSQSQTPPPCSVLPSSLWSSTLPPSSSISSSSRQSSGASQSGEHHDMTNMAFIRKKSHTESQGNSSFNSNKELSSKHQTSVPFRSARESTLI